jgi:hypothetical protein
VTRAQGASKGGRRLLRAKVAVEGELTVKLRRGEQTLELRVPCKD